MNSAIVSGAQGFIGSAVVRELRSRGVKVLALDRREDSLDSGVETVCADAGDFSSLLAARGKARGYDAYFNFAWGGVAGEELSNPRTQLANVECCLNQIKFCKEIACPLFINAGSIFEYAPLYVNYASETLPPLGTLIYGAAKRTAYDMGRALAKMLNIGYVHARITNTFGPNERANRFVKSTLIKILNHDPLAFTRATQMYDFVFITDLAKAFCLLGEHGIPNREYTIGSGEARPLRHFIDEMLEVCADGMSAEPVFGSVGFCGLDIPKEKFDSQALKSDTGFIPSVSFKSGIRMTRDWLIGGGREWRSRVTRRITTLLWSGAVFAAASSQGILPRKASTSLCWSEGGTLPAICMMP
jgi:nucleoside-diphosphate-sugar epimerase